LLGLSWCSKLLCLFTQCHHHHHHCNPRALSIWDQHLKSMRKMIAVDWHLTCRWLSLKTDTLCHFRLQILYETIQLLLCEEGWIGLTSNPC
jgi:hypothetical protein